MKFLLPALAAPLLILSGCGKKVPAPAATPSTEAAKVFAATGAHLDSGGDFYLYMRTENVLARIPAEIDSWKDALVESFGKDTPLTAEEIDKWHALIKKTLLDTGVTQLRAFGISGIELEPGLNRMRSVAYSGDIADRGLLWRLGGQPAPHPIAALDFLPASTIYAGFSDFDPNVLWAYIEGVMRDIPDEAMRSQALAMPEMVKAGLGMTPAELFATLGAEVGLVITADESRTMKVPMDNQLVTLPRAAGALLFRVKDDTLYDLIVSKFEATAGRMIPLEKSEKDGVKLATVTAVSSPDLPLRPTIARFGDYVAISTTDELVTQLARKGADPSPLLKDTPEFQRFAKLESLEANSFAYLTERGSEMLREFQLRSLATGPSPLPPALRTKVEQLYGMLSQKFVFSLGRVEKDGFTAVTYSPNGSEQLVATITLVPVAVIGALAMPAITAAQFKVLAEPVPDELAELEAAMLAYQNDNSFPVGAVIQPADLEPYIPVDTPLGQRLRLKPFVDAQGNPYPELTAGSPPRAASSVETE